MVAFRSLFTVSATILAASASVAATESLISVVENALTGLHARQVAGVDTNDIPAACRDSCTKVLSIANCTTIKCACTNDIASAIQSCYDCALNTDVAQPQSAYQSAADKYVDACKSAGSSVKSITISKDGGSNGAFSLAPTFGLIGLSAAAVILA